MKKNHKVGRPTKVNRVFYYSPLDIIVVVSKKGAKLFELNEVYPREVIVN